MTTLRWPRLMNMTGGLINLGPGWHQRTRPTSGRSSMTTSPKRCQSMTKVVIWHGRYYVFLRKPFNIFVFSFHRPWSVQRTWRWKIHEYSFRMRTEANLQSCNNLNISSVSQPLRLKTIHIFKTEWPLHYIVFVKVLPSGEVWRDENLPMIAISDMSLSIY